MLVFVRIVLVVYLLAINVYSFMLIYFQKTAFEEGDKCAIKDTKIFITGFLGGALGVYVAMFIYKHRLENLFLMVSMPVLICINAYIVFLCFSQNFGFIIQSPYGI